MIGTTRLYGAAIAGASGVYSVWSATTAADEMGTSGTLMLLVGLVVIVHGVVLLTPLAERLGRASGPLMVVYAVVMLAIQGLLALDMIDTGGTPPMMGDGMTPTAAGMAWDPAMVLLAALMLVSGLIMIDRPTSGRSM